MVSDVGFNLFFDSNNSGHIKVQNKYETITTDFQHGMNFTSVKLKANGRFLGLITNDEYTSLAIGFNNDSTGVNITDHIEV